MGRGGSTRFRRYRVSVEQGSGSEYLSAQTFEPDERARPGEVYDAVWVLTEVSGRHSHEAILKNRCLYGRMSPISPSDQLNAHSARESDEYDAQLYGPSERGDAPPCNGDAENHNCNTPDRSASIAKEFSFCCSPVSKRKFLGAWICFCSHRSISGAPQQNAWEYRSSDKRESDDPKPIFLTFDLKYGS
jgi:hypothetical protein